MPSMLLSDQSTLRHCFWTAKELGICDINRDLRRLLTFGTGTMREDFGSVFGAWFGALSW